jgi:hypothetical protein
LRRCPTTSSAVVVTVFELADALRFTAKESLVQDADCMAIGSGMVVIARQPINCCLVNLISAVSHFF